MELVNNMLITDSHQGKIIIPVYNIKFMAPHGADKTVIHLVTGAPGEEIIVNQGFDKTMTNVRDGISHGKMYTESLNRD